MRRLAWWHTSLLILTTSQTSVTCSLWIWTSQSRPILSVLAAPRCLWSRWPIGLYGKDTLSSGGNCESIQAPVGLMLSHMTKDLPSILSMMKSGRTKSRAKGVAGISNTDAIERSLVCRYMRARPRMPPGAVTSRLGTLPSINSCRPRSDQGIEWLHLCSRG